MAPTCTRSGCGKSSDSADPCLFHPGGPVFHEGLKSWSCCKDINKPVLEFDQFMAIEGCSKAESHSTNKKDVAEPTRPDKEPVPAPATKPDPAPVTVAVPANSQTQTFASKPAPPKAPVAPVEEKEEEDDLSAAVPAGKTCRRKGCGTSFVSDEENRLGDSAGTVCTYHPKAPIFHEGSKGYLCCKRRVLEFDEFLKIEGCKTGRHCFVPKVDPSNAEEQKVECRVDHYQTQTEVHVSVFAKQANKDTSTVKITDDELFLDIFLPASKRFTRTVPLFGPVDPQASSFKYYGTKVEIILKKADGRSWTLLEKTDSDKLGNYAYTFGVGGRTGTIGAKSMILDSQNSLTNRP